MTTDFRALCVELTDCLEKADWPNRYRHVFRQWVDIARAALADEPTVPEGREPAAVTGQPSDEELTRLWFEADGRAVLGPKEIGKRAKYARAVLARWGNPAPLPPAEGEVAELVRMLTGIAHWRRRGRPGEGDPSPFDIRQADRLDRAADLLQRLSPPQPPAEKEVAKLVKWLRQRWPRMAHISDPDYAIGVRIGDLMERLSPPQPMPVSERLPVAEDCDAEGRCWVWWKNGVRWVLDEWTHHELREGPLSDCVSHWLPAHALPVPEVSNG